jgi:hypothetical protein
LREIGIVATANPGGAGKWQPEMSERLRGADVILLPDNDDPGWKHIHQIGTSLVGIAGRTRVLALPDLPAKGDMTAPDWQPPLPEAPADKGKAKATTNEQALIDESLKPFSLNP